jgi:hypothetical protein
MKFGRSQGLVWNQTSFDTENGRVLFIGQKPGRLDTRRNGDCTNCAVL